jgi:hypothetical protein
VLDDVVAKEGPEGLVVQFAVTPLFRGQAKCERPDTSAEFAAPDAPLQEAPVVHAPAGRADAVLHVAAGGDADVDAGRQLNLPQRKAGSAK